MLVAYCFDAGPDENGKSRPYRDSACGEILLLRWVLGKCGNGMELDQDRVQ